MALVVFGLAACGKDTPAEITKDEQACVTAKEAEAIKAGRLDTEDPGRVAEWALRECGIDPKRASQPFAEPRRRTFEPPADNLQIKESTRPVPPNAD